MNDMTPTLYCSPELARKLDHEIHPWLLSEREGGNKTTLSYVKVDVLTDTLNKLFGPLGWGVEAEIQKMEDFQYEKPGWQGAAPTEMYVFQVISQVKLTIKAQTETGTPTIFIQSGIGYGEVKINAHRKDAVGMAVKGAESDGLKRCCNFLGRALGMFLVGGKQDPIVYAHNGNKNKTIVNRAMRDREDYEDRMRSRRDQGNARDDGDRGDNGADDGRRQEARGRDDRPARNDQQRDEQPRNDRQREEQPRENRQRDDRQREEQPRGDRQRDEPAREDQPRDNRQREQQPRNDRQRDEPARDEQPDENRQNDGQPKSNGGDARRDEKAGDQAASDDKPADAAARQDAGKDDARSEGGGNADEREGQSGRRRANARTGADAAKEGDGDAAKPEVKTRTKANTNYDLRKVPVTRENQKDFGATLVKQVEAMRQPEDRVQMVKGYAQRINELDPDFRALVVERLRERDVDVSILD